MFPSSRAASRRARRLQQSSRARRLMRVETLERREVLATAVAPDVFVFNAADHAGVGEYTLRLSGANLEIVETANPTSVLATQDLSATARIQVTGQDNVDDTLTIDISGGWTLPIDYEGGAAGFDTLALTGGSVNHANYYFTNKHDGRISLDGWQISYTGLEPISANITATDVTLNYGPADETITVSSPGAGQLQVASTSGEAVQMFALPTNSLTINGGGGIDTVTFTSNFTLPGDLNIYAENVTQTSEFAVSGTFKIAAQPPGAYTQAVLADNPANYFKFSETTGTNAVPTTGANNATYQGGVSLGELGAIPSDGVNNLAPHLNGSNGWIEILGNLPASLFSDGSYSIEVWFQSDTGAAGQDLAGMTDATGGNHGILLETLTGQHLRYLHRSPSGGGGGQNINPSNQSYTTGAWNHLVVVNDNNAMKLYLNGVLDSTTNTSSAAINYDIRAALGRIDVNRQERAFDGLLDEFAVYNNALSQAQVQAHFSAAQLQMAGEPVVVLNSAANDFNEVLLVNVASADVRDANDMTVRAPSVTGALKLTAAGQLILPENVNAGSVNYTAGLVLQGAGITTTAGGITVSGNAFTTDNVTLDTTAANGNIIFNDRLQSANPLAANLTINAGTGSVVFNGAVGLPQIGAVASASRMFVIEGENFFNRNDFGATDSWLVVPTEDSGAGPRAINARGFKYVQSLPDGSGGGGGPNATPNIEYQVQIREPGLYQLYLRLDGNYTDSSTAGASDSAFASIVELIDGLGAGTNADWYEYNFTPDANFNNQAWIGTGGFEINSADGNPKIPATWNITAPGTYTVRVSQREDGSTLDALILQDASYAAPTGFGPTDSGRLGTVTINSAGSIDANSTFQVYSYDQNVASGVTATFDNGLDALNNVYIDRGDAIVTGDLAAQNARVGLADLGAGTIANLTVTGGSVQIGGNGTSFEIGRLAANLNGTNVIGNADFRTATSVNVNVNDIRLGYITQGVNGFAEGNLLLSTTGDNVLAANNIEVGDSDHSGNTAVTSDIVFGGGNNTVNANTFEVGGLKSKGQVTILPGGVLTINNRAGTGNANLYIGRNNVSTGASDSGVFDMRGGTLNASLNNLVIGVHTAGSGSGVGTLYFETGTINVAGNVTLADPDTSANPANTTGQINQTGGAINITGGVIDGGGASTIRLENGTMTVGNGFDVDNLLVGLAKASGNVTATLTVNGGAVRIGDGSAGSSLSIGLRDSDTGAKTLGTVNLANATSANIQVDTVQLGAVVGTVGGGQGGVNGKLTLPTAGSVTIAAPTIVVEDSPAVGLIDSDFSLLALGSGVTNINADTFTVAGRKAEANLTILPGGVLNLAGQTGAATDLFIASNVTGTGTIARGNVNLSGGTFNATLDELRIARHGSGSAAGGAVGTLTFDAGTVNVREMVLGQASVSTTNGSNDPRNTVGTLTMNGGALTVSGGDTILGLNGGIGNLIVNSGTVNIGAGGGDDFFVGRRTQDVLGNPAYTGAAASTANLSGANSVNINVAILGVGSVIGGGGGQIFPNGTLLLGQNNTLTASNQIVIADSPSVGLGGNVNRLGLGQNNNIQTPTFMVGGSKGNGRLDFNTPGGSLTLGAAGSPVDLLIANQTVGTGGGSTGVVDLSAGTVTAFLDLLRVGSKPDNATGTTTGTFTMNAGSVDANTIQIAQRTNAGTAGTVNGTLNQNGGTLRFGALSQNGNSAAFNFNSGTIQNLPGQNLSDTNVVINVLTGAAHTFTVDAGQTATIQTAAQLAGTGPLTKNGGGALVLPGANPLSGTTSVTAGALQVDGSLAGPVVTSSGGTLSGQGAVNNTVTGNSGGLVAPGPATKILTTGNLVLNSGSTYAVEINGTTPGAQHDQLNVQGSVALNNATLSITGTAPNAAPGTAIVIITNDGGDAVSGTFNGLPEFAQVSVNGERYRITYRYDAGSGTLGSGNDVALIRNRPPVAVADSFTTPEDTTLTANVVTNPLGLDSDPDGDPLTAVLATGPSFAAAFNLTASGAFTYTPSANFSGADSFTYYVNDGELNSNTVTVSLTVTAVADPPNLVVTNVSGGENNPIPLQIQTSLNDTDGSETLSVIIAGVPSDATLSAGINQGGGVWRMTGAEANAVALTKANNNPGNAPFTLTVTATATETSNNDSASVTRTMSVTVNNLPPLPEQLDLLIQGESQGPVPSVSVVPGVPVTFVVTTTDPAGVDDMLNDLDAPFQFTINFGDGSSAQGELLAEGQPLEFTHVYNDFSDEFGYQPTLTVTDVDGASTTIDLTSVVVSRLVVIDGVLYVGGTDRSERIIVQSSNSQGVFVKIDGRNYYPSEPVWDRVVVYGNGGSDSITVTGYVLPVEFYGGAGNDYLAGSSYADLLDGGEGNDRILGGNGDDVLLGGGGNDRLSGGNGNDYLHGDDTVDNVSGMAVYFDSLEREISIGHSANPGRDTLAGDNGDDIVDGGPNDDRVAGGNGNDIVRGGAGNDRVDGGNDDDLVLGDDGADLLYGRAGNDVLIGGYGIDSLYGESGDDLLYGSGLFEDVELDDLIAIWMSWRDGDSEGAADALTDLAMDDLVGDTLHGDRGIDWYLLFAEYAVAGKDRLRVASDGRAPNEVRELM
jgi:autotransporter-associated beta strand protein